jgi:hypothetical protein
MKIRMTNSFYTTEVYETIEINPNDYEELEGLSNDEIIEYLNENGYDFALIDGEEVNIVDEIRFSKEIVKEKTSDEDIKFILIKED